MKFVLRVIVEFKIGLRLYMKNYNWWVSCLEVVLGFKEILSVLEKNFIFSKVWVKINISGKMYEILYLILVWFLNIFLGSFVKRMKYYD